MVYTIYTIYLWWNWESIDIFQRGRYTTANQEVIYINHGQYLHYSGVINHNH